MNFDDPLERAVFFDVHTDLPREGPGNRASTARALRLVGPLPEPASVLDIGCGPGQQTLQLAELVEGGRVVGVDLHPPFLDALGNGAARAGLGQRVEARLGDMTALDFPAGTFDLIWCEAAVYIMGFAEALEAWKPFLKPRGKMAISEVVWLRPDPPPRLRRFWREYPGMKDVATCRDRITEAGYELLGDFVLPEEAWWESYYTPMSARLDRLRSKYAGDVVAEAVLAECEEEIEVYRRYKEFYGYGFFVMARGAR